MSTYDPEASIIDWVIDHPGSISFFQECGIGYCCAGKSFRYAWLQAGVDPKQVLRRLLDLFSPQIDGST